MTTQTAQESTTSRKQQEHANGSAWACVLAAGIGCAAFGVITDVAECSNAVNAKLSWYSPAGGLSGVAGCALIIWLAAWALLNARWNRRHFAGARGIMAMSLILVFIGLLATFPPFYELFAGD